MPMAKGDNLLKGQSNDETSIILIGYSGLKNSQKSIFLEEPIYFIIEIEGDNLVFISDLNHYPCSFIAGNDEKTIFPVSYEKVHDNKIRLKYLESNNEQSFWEDFSINNKIKLEFKYKNAINSETELLNEYEDFIFSDLFISNISTEDENLYLNNDEFITINYNTNNGVNIDQLVSKIEIKYKDELLSIPFSDPDIYIDQNKFGFYTDLIFSEFELFHLEGESIDLSVLVVTYNNTVKSIQKRFYIDDKVPIFDFDPFDINKVNLYSEGFFLDLSSTLSLITTVKDFSYDKTIGHISVNNNNQELYPSWINGQLTTYFDKEFLLSQNGFVNKAEIVFTSLDKNMNKKVVGYNFNYIVPKENFYNHQELQFFNYQGQEVSADDYVIFEQVNLIIPTTITSYILEETIQVRFLGLDNDAVYCETSIIDENINIDFYTDVNFPDNTSILMEVSFEDMSHNKYLITNIKGPKIEKPFPPSFSVNFIEIPFNMWEWSPLENQYKFSQEIELKNKVIGNDISAKKIDIIENTTATLIKTIELINEVKADSVIKFTLTTDDLKKVDFLDDNDEGYLQLKVELHNEAGVTSEIAPKIIFSKTPNVYFDYKDDLVLQREIKDFEFITNYQNNLGLTVKPSKKIDANYLWENATIIDDETRETIVVARFIDQFGGISEDTLNVLVSTKKLIEGNEEAICMNTINEIILSIDSFYSQNEDTHIQIVNSKDSILRDFDNKTLITIEADKLFNKESSIKQEFKLKYFLKEQMIADDNIQLRKEKEVTQYLKSDIIYMNKNNHELFFDPISFESRFYSFEQNDHIDFSNQVYSLKEDVIPFSITDGNVKNIRVLASSEGDECGATASYILPILTHSDLFNFTVKDIEQKWVYGKINNEEKFTLWPDSIQQNSWVIDQEILKIDTLNHTGIAAVYSPVFDLSQFYIPVLEMSLDIDLDNKNAVFLQYSTDYGDSWEMLGDQDSTFWFPYNVSSVYNNSIRSNPNGIGWSYHDLENQLIKFNLSNIKEQGNIAFRLICTGNATQLSSNSIGLKSFSILEQSHSTLVEIFPNATLTNQGDLLDDLKKNLKEKRFVDVNIYSSNSCHFSNDHFLSRNYYYNTSQNHIDNEFLVFIDGELIDEVTSDNFLKTINNNLDRTLLKSERFNVELTQDENQIQSQFYLRQPILSEEKIYCLITTNESCDSLEHQFINYFGEINLIENSWAFDLNEISLSGKELNVTYIIQNSQSKNIESSKTYDITLDYQPITSTHKNNFTFKVYPNPMDDVLNIKTQNSLQIKYQIYNITGQAVQSGELNKDENINVSRIKKGVYLLHLYDKQNKYTHIEKLIKL